MWYVVFCDWHLSFSIIFSRFIHAMAWISSFLFYCQIISFCEYSTSYLSSCWWIFELFSLFSYYESSSCYENSYTHFIWHVFISLGYLLRSGAAGSYGNSRFSNFQKSPDCLQSRCIILYFYQPGLKFIQPSPTLIINILFFIIIAILVVLICISLIVNDTEQIFMCLLACISSLQKCLFIAFTHLGYLFFYFWAMRILYIF